MTDYWPWWLGAIGLASVAGSLWLLDRRLLGVSGSVGRLASLADRDAREEEALVADQERMRREMEAAAREHFSEEEIAAALASEQDGEMQVAAGRMPPRVHATFLIMVVVGGALGSLMRSGSLEVHGSLGATFESFFGTGWVSFLVLFAGGTLVGLGTRMSGGCTSGHGLTGCSRLVPASLLATAVFFGTGIAVSFALRGLFL